MVSSFPRLRLQAGAETTAHSQQQEEKHNKGVQTSAGQRGGSTGKLSGTFSVKWEVKAAVDDREGGVGVFGREGNVENSPLEGWEHG